MTQRNIHGEWTMNFEDRILYSTVSGATNREASLGWLHEMQEKIGSSREKDTTPWVICHDCRNWIGAAPDVWETNNIIMDWLTEHNCIFMASVLPGEMQIYLTEKELRGQYILQCFVSYDEAHQACLDRLAEARKQHDK